MFLKVKKVEDDAEDDVEDDAEYDIEDVNESLRTMTEEGPGKYAVFALFVLICIILGLLVLTVLIGLLSTVFGCCKVSDDVLPTERDSGPCGNLLMCTSYCSVILCAFATLVAAILVTVVIASEGTCKQYSDGKLIGGLEDVGEALGQDLDLDEMLITVLKLGDDQTMNIENVLELCSQNETFFKALDLKQDTNLFGMFSFNSMKDEVDKQIATFNVEDALKDLDFEPELLSDEAKADITSSKNSLNDYDFAAMKTTVADTETTAITSEKMDEYITEIGKLKVQYTYMAECETALTDIKDTKIPAVETSKAALDAPLSNMITIKTNIVTKIDELLDAIGKMDDRFNSDDFSIKSIVLEEVNKAIDKAKTLVSEFIDFLYGQFRTSIGNCQPIPAVYHTILNYTCDGILIHITLLYCGLSLVGISLLFYMCVSRCLARYFIKFSQLHPEDEGGNGCRLEASRRWSSSRVSGTKSGYSGKRSARDGQRVLITSPTLDVSVPADDIILISNPTLTRNTVRTSVPNLPHTTSHHKSPPPYGEQQFVTHIPDTPRARASILPPLENMMDFASDTSSF
ncbi:uncharacterized protein LOC134823757 [Bolinopsis microptera]|uniref:uncharacterized protein LOC134823757 n=1 Tax=Bolinopsis microptera TaxID=2820187 RepID=UPI003079C381